MNKPLSAALLASMLLAGCASYVARPLHPRRSAAQWSRRGLSDPRLLRFLDAEQRRSAPPRWNLGTLALVAVYERPDMPLARARLREAQGGAITASELPNPTLSIAPTYNTSTSGPPWKVGPVLSFLVQSWGARPARIAAARARIEEARQELAITAWRLRGQVRTAMLRLWSSEQAVRLARRRARLAGRYRRAVRQRYRAGMVAATALSTAGLAYGQAELRLAAQLRDAHLARAALAAALGLPSSALDGVELDMAGIAHPRPPGRLRPLIRSALTRRPELLAALANYAVAQASLRLAVAEQYPSLEIGPGYHYDQGDNKFILSIALPLPVLNQNQGPIAQARAARAVAAEQFLAVQMRVLAQIDRARADWHASEAELARARGLRRAAREALKRQRIARSAGQIGRLRLLGAELACVQARQATLAASVHERGALGRLESALYHPFLVASRNP